jgi:hypothetical protein
VFLHAAFMDHSFTNTAKVPYNRQKSMLGGLLPIGTRHENANFGTLPHTSVCDGLTHDQNRLKSKINLAKRKK